MEEKIWEKAKNAIRGILEAAGYEVSPVEDPFFLAEREGEYLLVLCSNDQTEIKEFDTTSYRVMQEGKEITYKKLLFSLADSPPAENSIVWGTSEFVRFAGEASLARILDRTLSLSLAAPGGSPACKCWSAPSPIPDPGWPAGGQMKASTTTRGCRPPTRNSSLGLDPPGNDTSPRCRSRWI